MKTVIKPFLITLLTLNVFISCDSVFVVDRHSYVQAYTEYSNELEVFNVSPQQGLFDFVVAAKPAGRYANIRSRGNDKVWFDELCQRNGDVSYENTKRKVGYDWVYEYHPCCITPDLFSVELLTERDYDTNHPAGSSVSDCMEVSFQSADYFIREGYPKEKEDAYTGLTTKLLKDVVPEDLKLLVGPEYLFKFRIVNLPQQPQAIHTFHIICKDVYGRMIKGRIDFSLTE